MGRMRVSTRVDLGAGKSIVLPAGGDAVVIYSSIFGISLKLRDLGDALRELGIGPEELFSDLDEGDGEP